MALYFMPKQKCAKDQILMKVDFTTLTDPSSVSFYLLLITVKCYSKDIIRKYICMFLNY